MMTGHSLTEHVEQEFTASLAAGAFSNETGSSSGKLPGRSDINKLNLDSEQHKDWVLLKNVVRSSSWTVGHEVRAELWPAICHQSGRSGVALYKETAKTLFHDGEQVQVPQGLRPTGRQNTPSYHLSATGRRALERVLAVVGRTHPDIVYAPHVPCVAALFLHYVASEAQVYDSVCALLAGAPGGVADGGDKSWALPQTHAAYDIQALSFGELCKKFAKSSYKFISRVCDKSEDSIQKVMQEWTWWIFRDLPFPYLVRVFDCYLAEGNKILYRIALALLISFFKFAEANAVHIRQGDAEGLAAAIKRYVQQPSISCDKLLKVSFGIRGLSRKDVAAALAEAEAKSAGAGRRPTRLSIPHQDYLLDTVDIPGSQLHKYLKQVWKWVPARYAIQSPKLLFTTAEHGESMTTFLQRLDGHEPTIILIRTTRDEVFGCYASVDWAERHAHAGAAYFGTGETFLFHLEPSPPRHYPWAGIAATQRGDQVPHRLNMFMAVQENRIIQVGGGSGVGLELGPSLEGGRTQACDTFANEPLSAGRDFGCRVVEAFGFTP